MVLDSLGTLTGFVTVMALLSVVAMATVQGRTQLTWNR
jgi:hypothetical protein